MEPDVCITLHMDRAIISYLVGMNRANLIRLERCTNAKITAGSDLVDIKGTRYQVDLARLCILSLIHI